MREAPSCHRTKFRIHNLAVREVDSPRSEAAMYRSRKAIVYKRGNKTETKTSLCPRESPTGHWSRARPYRQPMSGKRVLPHIEISSSPKANTCPLSGSPLGSCARLNSTFWKIPIRLAARRAHIIVLCHLVSYVPIMLSIHTLAAWVTESTLLERKWVLTGACERITR